MMNKRSPYSLARSFACAFRGFIYALCYERNMRIHFFISVYVIYFSRYFELSRAEYAVLFVIIGLVISCEMTNTAIEAAVDLSTPVYSDLAKIAKDVAAGAVLVSAAASVVVGCILFWRPASLLQIWSDILAAPFIWLFLIAITIFLIAWPERRRQENKTTNKKGKLFPDIKENE